MYVKGTIQLNYYDTEVYIFFINSKPQQHRLLAFVIHNEVV